MARLICSLVLCSLLVAPAGASSLEALLELRPSSASTKHPLVPKHLPHDAIDGAYPLTTTAWPMAKTGGRSLHPAPGAPWSNGRLEDTPAASYLAWWSGDTADRPEGLEDAWVADVTLALALEEWMGRIRGSSLLDALFEVAVAYARAPTPESRARLLDEAETVMVRNHDLWERAAFLVAGGFLGAACHPDALPWPARGVDADDAASLLDAILAIRPGSSPTLTLRGHLHWWWSWRSEGRRDVPGQAIEAWDRALRNLPDDGGSALALAHAYRLAGQPGLAHAWLASWSPHLDDWKKPLRARAYRILASLAHRLGRGEPTASWTAGPEYRLRERAQDLAATVGGGLGLLASVDQLAASGDAILLEDPIGAPWEQRTRVARDLVEMDDLGEDPTAWQTSTRPLISILLEETVQGLEGVDDPEVRDERIEDLHWAWVAFFDTYPDSLGPDRALTEGVLALVEESNERRWKARRLKTGRYEDALDR